MDRLSEFRARLQELKYNILLSIEFTNSTPIYPNQKTAKLIVHQVNQWLYSKPKVGESNEIRNFRFTVSSNDSNGLNIIGPMLVFTGNTSSLNEKIYDKVSDYKNLNYPFIVAFVPTFHSYISCENVEENLYGKLSWQLKASHETEIFSKLPVRDNSGLYKQASETLKSLSGIMYVPKKLGVELNPNDVVIFPNPNAIYPIDAKDFSVT